MRALDLTGQRFGMLAVVRQAERDEHSVTKCQREHPQRWWIVVCDCGTVKATRAATLKNGESKSCGCAMKAWRKKFGKSRTRPEGEAAKWAAYVTQRRHAERRGMIWAVSLEQFLTVTSKPCTYCGALGLKETQNNTNGTYRYNGIDRVDNRVGCWSCNAAKGTKTVEQFKAWVARVYKHLAVLE